MKIRDCAIIILFTLVLGIFGVIFLLPAPRNQTNIVEINDITATLAADFEQLGTSAYTPPGVGLFNYTVLDSNGSLLAATRSGLSEDLYAAVRNGDIVVDIVRNNQIVGKVIFQSDMERRWQASSRRAQVYIIVILLVNSGILLLFLKNINAKILRPFQNMRGFAQRVAMGEFDIPLEMDERNAFGAFTESFDLMRDAIHQARENERIAEQSKRELAAALSHDIQNPVASIRAVAELMEVTASEPERKKLQTIQQKAGQIHTLMADLFSATLEELNALSVKPAPFLSAQLADMIAKADYQKLARIEEIPGCLLWADPIRLAQVIDNIIANAYKYAGTRIHVSAEMEDDGLALILRDYGPGADPDELSFLCGKYYRGRSVIGKSGFGLGLYLSRNLTERMGGRLTYANAHPGFLIKIWLQLDGYLRNV